MNPEKQHPLQRYWALAAAPIQAEALSAALALGIFESLVEPRTADELAAQLDLDSRNTAHLLELLWGMGLLDRSARLAADHIGGSVTVYGLAEVGRAYFLAASPTWSFFTKSCTVPARSRILMKQLLPPSRNTVMRPATVTGTV